MASQKPFDQNYVKENAQPKSSGFLDQLNLPPGVVFFMEKYHRIILITTVLILITAISIPLYNSWHEYRDNNAATALAEAMRLDGETKIAQLEQVSEQYTTTPSGLWAMVTLAQIAADQGNLADAAAQLSVIRENISRGNPLEPLLIVRMAKINEELEKFDEAISLYQELIVFPGFVADAYYSMGRVYAVMDKNSEAVSKYQQYLAEIDKTGRDKSDLHRAIVEKTIGNLM